MRKSLPKKGVSTWDEKIKCLYCQKVLLKKCLGEHTKTIHKGLPEKFASTVNKLMIDFVKKVPASSCSDTDSSDKFGESHLSESASPVNESVNPHHNVCEIEGDDDSHDTDEPVSDSDSEPPPKKTKSDSTTADKTLGPGVNVSHCSNDAINQRLQHLSDSVDKLLKLQSVRANLDMLKEIQSTSSDCLSETETMEVIRH